MATSIDIDDALLERAHRRAHRDQITIKQLIETGLRLALKEPKPDPARRRFQWPLATASMTQPLNEVTVNQQIDALREAALDPWLSPIGQSAPGPKRPAPR